MIANPAIPMIGFGMPNASACSVAITEPHDRTGLTSQRGTESGSATNDSFSTNKITAAKRPMRPPTRRRTPWPREGANRVPPTDVGLPDSALEGVIEGFLQVADTLRRQLLTVKEERRRPGDSEGLPVLLALLDTVKCGRIFIGCSKFVHAQTEVFCISEESITL